jgi:hypothetical protein
MRMPHSAMRQGMRGMSGMGGGMRPGMGGGMQPDDGMQQGHAAGMQQQHQQHQRQRQDGGMGTGLRPQMRPHMGDPQMNSPQMGGPQVGGSQMGGPQMSGGPQLCSGCSSSTSQGPQYSQQQVRYARPHPTHCSMCAVCGVLCVGCGMRCAGCRVRCAVCRVPCTVCRLIFCFDSLGYQRRPCLQVARNCLEPLHTKTAWIPHHTIRCLIHFLDFVKHLPAPLRSGATSACASFFSATRTRTRFSRELRDLHAHFTVIPVNNWLACLRRFKRFSVLSVPPVPHSPRSTFAPPSGTRHVPLAGPVYCDQCVGATESSAADRVRQDARDWAPRHRCTGPCRTTHTLFLQINPYRTTRTLLLLI